MKTLGTILKRIIRNVHYSTIESTAKPTNWNLSRAIYQQIQTSGPISVADYMKLVLTHPSGGYYMHKEAIGEEGDFITSPEISQLFGEMIAVWLINEWRKMGSPKPFQIVELGPGKGSLSADILRVFNYFKIDQTELRLVEVSPRLRRAQADRLGVKVDMDQFEKGTTDKNITVNWHRHLNEVPRKFSLFVAHEFFDALPVHKFHKTDAGYREILIDIDKSSVKDQPMFRYILARNPTPMQVLLDSNEARHDVEISPESVLLYKDICERIKTDGGVALICDYGHFGGDIDSFRAFKNHQQVHPLNEPGSSDLTADVDFRAITKVADDVQGVLTFGPVTQRDFLLRTGLDVRVDSLKQTLKDAEQLENIDKCFDYLTNNSKMGERFKFMAILPETMKPILDVHPVVGFTNQ
ncbi:unnamed protein product [Phyllotreta striolata]|uniref:Protein arginine methyltransferase NDUFAF7 n=1 Tax=Phyllotreta striolata TaxID=444603 RepID=A0A9N9TKQ0_PHYSR|nr:unnamed protein product [Phyllotreta striolata]